MSRIDLVLLGGGHCRIVHTDSGVELRSSVAPEYGGAGGTFSSTDLLAAALGSCIATNLEPVAIRHAVPLDAIRIQVEKRLGTSPKRVESLEVTVRVRAAVGKSVLDRLKRAADRCVVHRSLSEAVFVGIAVESEGG